MAKQTFEMTLPRKMANAVIGRLVKAGVGPKGTYLLTTRGRRTGTPRTNPVVLIEDEGGRFLVAPYGEVAWVRNARAAGEVTVARGRRTETLPITEVGPAQSAPVLKRYLAVAPIVRPYFDALKDSPVEHFEKEADRHPVFRLGSDASLSSQ